MSQIAPKLRKLTFVALVENRLNLVIGTFVENNDWLGKWVKKIERLLICQKYFEDSGGEKFS